MRVAVLPRDVASRIITSALARAFAAINATSLILNVPMLVEFLVARDLAWALPAPLLILAILIALAIRSVLRPDWVSLLLFLVIGTIGAAVFQIMLIEAYPAFLDEGLYILNRPTIALVLVGITASTVRQGFAWSLVGFGLSTVVALVVAVVAATPFTPGYGALFNLIATTIAYSSLAFIQASLRRRVPDFDRFEDQTRRVALEESLRLKVTAAVHDTLLNDLSLVINAPDTLDERMSARLREDVRTLTSTEWLTSSEMAGSRHPDSELRNEIMRMLSDLQWRGLTVHITGTDSSYRPLSPETPAVLVEVVRACLENVLKHSGTTVADVDLGYSDTDVTIIVTDHGHGFDPASIANDRIGLRTSVIDRMEAIGGSARIWSTPGNGTSVVLHVPLTPAGEVPSAHA